MNKKYRIKWSGLAHDSQRWAKDRNVKGGMFPAVFQVADKPNGKKGKPIAYNDAKLRKLYLLNGGRKSATDKEIAADPTFRFITRLGGWLFNSAQNRQLIGLLKNLLSKFAGKTANSFVPFPLPKGKKALAEKIYCESNVVTVDKEKGQWVHIKAGTAQLVQVGVGTGKRYPSNVFWEVPAGWVEKKHLERI